VLFQEIALASSFPSTGWAQIRKTEGEGGLRRWSSPDTSCERSCTKVLLL